MTYDWHGGVLARATAIDAGYRNTQNVRRFLTAQCGPDFAFDRALMTWRSDGSARTMDDVADEWMRRRA